MKFSEFQEAKTGESGMDWSKPSKAVVASDDMGRGVVLWTAGPHVASCIETEGPRLDDLGLDADAPEGISVWEGTIRTTHIHTPDCNEWESHLVGTFRAPTDEEWTAIRAGKSPWRDSDWHLPDVRSVP